MTSDVQPEGGRPGPVASGDSDLQTFTLESLSSAVNYHTWLCDLVRPFLGDDPLEIGSGMGDYAATWVATGQERITVSDVDARRRARLEQRFADEPRVMVRDLDVFAPGSGSYSALVGINVLEHIEDDSGALRSAHQLLRAGGKVVIFVPAFPFAMSRFDRSVGHYRRYRRASLRRAFSDAGLQVELLHYVNAPGLLAWFAGMRLLRMTPQDGVTVRLWDRAVVPVARGVESRIRLPFGQSLIAVGSTGT